MGRSEFSVSDAEKTGPVELPLEWDSDPEVIPAQYSNIVTAAVTAEELLLIFGQKSGLRIKRDKIVIVPVAKLALPHGMLPALIGILQEVAKNLEIVRAAGAASGKET